MATTPFTLGRIHATQVNTGVASKHPEYIAREDEWHIMRDAYEGETAIKIQGTEYLPMPSGFTKFKDRGVAAYDAYRDRAEFPEILSPTVAGMQGLIHRVEVQITIPDAMESLWERATKDGLSLESLYKRVTQEVLITGRYVLMAEAAPADQGGSEVPWIAGYSAESLLNWSKDRDFFVLDESEFARSGFTWTMQHRYRVLELEDGQYVQKLYEGYDESQNAEPLEPTVRGGDRMTEIPLVVIGTNDLSVETNKPPLIGVARASKNMYQLSADYRYQLYMSGQETLFVFGMDEPEVIGAGVIVQVAPTPVDQHPPDAMYVGPECKGIEAHLVAMDKERDYAASSGAKMFETSRETGQESGDSRRIRYAAETATLTSVSVTAAQGFEKVLKYIATMMGLDADEVVVKPNLRFVDTILQPSEATHLVKAWQDGAISYPTLYENLQRGEIASSERDADEELDLIEEEEVAAQRKLEAQRAAGIIPMPVPPGQQQPTEPQQQPIPGEQQPGGEEAA